MPIIFRVEFYNEEIESKLKKVNLSVQKKHNEICIEIRKLSKQLK